MVGVKDLKDVKEGDLIVVMDRTGLRSRRQLVRVLKATKTRVVVKHQEFNRNGSLVGGGGYCQISACAVTPELEAAVRREMKADRLKHAAHSIDWDAMTLEQLTALDALYKTLPVKAKD